MPKVEAKTIQKEIESGRFWPVYWLYGPERMKSREVLKRLQSAVSAGNSMGREVIDASESDAGSILDAAQSMTLNWGGGGTSTRLIVIQEAHLIKEAETLAPLLTSGSGAIPGKLEDFTSICVFVSKDLDARKKFSKLLLEKAACVPCEEVAESDREPWLQFLAKRRGLSLAPEWIAQLTTLDPWSLDIVDQELEKVALVQGAASDTAAAESPAPSPMDVLQLGSTGGLLGGVGDAFLTAFFTRKKPRALELARWISERPDESIPLMGLLAWNVRHLALIVAERNSGGPRLLKLNPYVAEKLTRWSRDWTIEELQGLQSKLAEIDYATKQTPLLPLGLWGELVIQYAQ